METWGQGTRGPLFSPGVGAVVKGRSLYAAEVQRKQGKNGERQQNKRRKGGLMKQMSKRDDFQQQCQHSAALQPS